MTSILFFFLSLTFVKVNNALEEEEPSAFSIKSGIPDPQTPWPYKTIVYESFKDSDQMFKTFEKVKAEIKSRTCVRFRKRLYQMEIDYILVMNKQNVTKCSNQVGKKGQVQILNLNTKVPKRAYYHELLHALGFHHEHNRYDRDLFVTINTENIRPDMLEYFDKRNSTEVWESTIPYDYESVLHFSESEGTSDPSKTTITALYRYMEFGEGNHLSVLDVQKINKLYCPGTIGIRIQNVASKEYLQVEAESEEYAESSHYNSKWTVDWYAMRNESRGSTLMSWSQPLQGDVVKALSEDVRTQEISTKVLSSSWVKPYQKWWIKKWMHPKESRWQIFNFETGRCLSFTGEFKNVTAMAECDVNNPLQLWKIIRIFK